MIPPIGLAPNEELAAIIQCATIGALVGGALAARQRIREPEADLSMPPLMWGLLGIALGLLGEHLSWW